MAENGTVGLGDLVKDDVTGFTGVAVAITQWLNGCRRINLQPRELDEKGGVKHSETFDENQITVVERAAVKGENVAAPGRRTAAPTGGPRDDAAALRR